MPATVAKPRKWGWLVLDSVGTLALMAGLVAIFAPEVAADLGIPVGLAWPLIVVGAVATLFAILMFFRQLRAQQTG